MTSKPQGADWDRLTEPVADRVRRHFNQVLEARGYRADRAQQAAIEQLGDWLGEHLAGRKGWLRRRVAGVYLWGGVGRGKSFVMDAFFAAAPVPAKRRVHFHGFLQELQQRMLAFSGQPDPLAQVAREIAGQTRLLCFDEFHVHDIGDAMLLGRLFKVLVEAGVGLVCTSNYSPAGLCPNPLYRERFQSAIGLIERRFQVLSVEGGEDYRQRGTAQEAWGSYCWPQSAHADSWLGQALGLTSAAQRDVTLAVNHRPLSLRAYEGPCAWLDFSALCRQPRASADYLWLCQRFQHLAVSGVPCLDGEGLDVQQRLLNFIDIAYDSGIRLLLGCETSLAALCRAGAQVDFSRTLSRLQQLKPVRTDVIATLSEPSACSRYSA